MKEDVAYLINSNNLLLLWRKSKAVRDLFIVLFTGKTWHHIDPPCEHLVKVTTETMFFSALFICFGEVEVAKFLNDYRHVLVEDTT